MFQMVAFDMDGTIADTIPMCIEAFRNSVSPYTDHLLSEKEVLQAFGLNEVGMVKAVAGKNWETAIQDFYLEYALLHDKVTEPFPGILNLLAYLKQKKIIVVLITGKGEKSCMISLEKLGLLEIFDEILYGSEVSPNKKENIEVLLKKYSISREHFCYIGDTVQDIKSCNAAGVVCFSAAWQKSSDVAALKNENPKYVFYHVRDLYQFL